ncbi:hypothetical protein NE235_32455 [Actinoallomurus spadix]|uniref:hypothetical protein n=1 Tax=Actinoallomurus spadix TaxID=79912 RepID=UPI00209291FF|nr:hypothetical protein [Actinoallomurus spadix]MCO5990834.1 hypothetical protein [Actinoallomurus spadix]
MRANTACRPIALIGLGLAATLGMSMTTDAEAEQVLRGAPAVALSGDSNHIGNGHQNASANAIRSPTHLRGIQQVADANVLSKIIRNNVVCRKRHFCSIRQRAIIIGR